MPFVRISSAKLAEIRQERAFEDGETLRLVSVVSGLYDPNSKKFVNNESTGVRRTFMFLCADGRKLQLSRLWGSRNTEGGRVLSSDAASPVQDLCAQLPFVLSEKLNTYLQRCGADGTYDADNMVIDCLIHKQHVENAVAPGFKDWYRLSDVEFIEVKPAAAEPSTAQVAKVKQFATAADVQISDADLKWWVAALQL